MISESAPACPGCGGVQTGQRPKSAGLYSYDFLDKKTTVRRVNGTGLGYMGSKNKKLVGHGQEEVDVTEFFTFIWIPVLPIRSLRIRRAERQDLIQVIARETAWVEDISLVCYRSLDFGQIFEVYMKFMAIVAAFWVLGWIFS